MDTALYFPYMDVPEAPWFSQVLLYWDQAATIVPESFDRPYERMELPPHMQELQRENLLRTMAPDAALRGHELSRHAFDDGFRRVLDGYQSPGPEIFYGARLHADKLSYGCFEELRRRGLARRPENGWYAVERGAAGKYMAYLASVMSKLEPGTIPVTDNTSAVSTLAAGHEDGMDRRLASLRYSVVQAALPTPSVAIPARQLRQFKEEHSEQLHRCRRYLDSRLAELAAEPDEHLREVATIGLGQEIQDDVANLTERMNKRRWPIIVLTGFGGVMSVALTTAAAAASGDSTLAIGLGVGAGAAQLGSAGYTTAQLLTQPRFNPREPLAYAVLSTKLDTA